jgi:glutamate synthase domain-containing protein 2
VYEAPGYEWINHSMAPTVVGVARLSALTIGGPDTARSPIQASVFNISAMSFGALSANAIQALNAGCQTAAALRTTRARAPFQAHHRVHGGDLIWEIGSGYFGCRNDDGTFNADKFRSQRAAMRR